MFLRLCHQRPHVPNHQHACHHYYYLGPTYQHTALYRKMDCLCNSIVSLAPVSGFIQMLYNARWLGTHLATPHTPITPEGRMKQGRLSFILSRIFHISLLSCISSVQGLAFGILLDPQLTDYLATKELYFRRLTDVTVRETVIRIWTITAGQWSTYAVLTILHDLLACVFVAVGLDEPKDWPPLFGSFPKYTLYGTIGRGMDNAKQSHC